MANLADGFLYHAKKNPRKAAFVLDSSSICYAELAVQALRWRLYLADRDSGLTTDANPEPKDTSIASGRTRQLDQSPEESLPSVRYVAWSGQNHEFLPSLYLACVQSGYCLMLLDPTWPAQTTSDVLTRFSPFCLITPDTVQDRFQDTHKIDDSLHDSLQDTHNSLQDSLQDTHKIDDSLQDTHNLLQDTHKIDEFGTDRFECLPASSAESCFLLGFTSGSSGSPKAFVRRQQSWLTTFEHAGREFPRYSMVLAPGPLSHGLSFYTMAETLHTGGTFYCQTRFNAERVWHTLRSQAISTLVVVPTMLLAIIDSIEASQDQTDLKLIISAGAKLSPAVWGKLQSCWPEVAVSEYYGASELSFVSVSHTWESAPKASVGRAFSGVEIIIRDPDGRAMGPNQEGEVFVDSDMLAEGYLHDTASLSNLRKVYTSASVGDRGKLDEDGNLYLIDRLDNMIISGGLNIYPSDVRQVLEAHPAVSESVVTGIDDEYWGEIVCAFIRLNTGDSPGEISIRDFCRQHLSAHQVPRRILTIGAWPMTTSGKIALAELRVIAVGTGDLDQKYNVQRVLNE